jgi:hypothetical protein
VQVKHSNTLKHDDHGKKGPHSKDLKELKKDEEISIEEMIGPVPDI